MSGALQCLAVDLIVLRMFNIIDFKLIKAFS